MLAHSKWSPTFNCLCLILKSLSASNKDILYNKVIELCIVVFKNHLKMEDYWKIKVIVGDTNPPITIDLCDRGNCKVDLPQTAKANIDLYGRYHWFNVPALTY